MYIYIYIYRLKVEFNERFRGDKIFITVKSN